jgi:hypothetical protein
VGGRARRSRDSQDGGEQVAGVVVALGQGVGLECFDGERHEGVEALVLTDQPA